MKQPAHLARQVVDVLPDDDLGEQAGRSERRLGIESAPLGSLAFVDVRKASASPIAEKSIHRIGALYATEANLRDLDDEPRQRIRI